MSFRNRRDFFRFAALIWQMPDGGPEVTYEWARTGAPREFPQGVSRIG
jgi:hypothetical protein